MSDRAAPDWLTRQTYAHRGLHRAGVVENSRSAILAALDGGFGIECDVQLSRDNVPMVFHDWELDRLTAESGDVAARDADDLSEIALSGSADTIWRLAEMLELVRGKTPILIEIKSLPDFDIANACSAIASCICGYDGPLAVMSFDPRMGEWFAAHAPHLTRGLVATDTYDHGFLSAWRTPGALERARPDFLACDIRDLPNALSEIWREADRPLLTWTVRSHELSLRAQTHADAAISEGEAIG